MFIQCGLGEVVCVALRVSSFFHWKTVVRVCMLPFDFRNQRIFSPFFSSFNCDAFMVSHSLHFSLCPVSFGIYFSVLCVENRLLLAMFFFSLFSRLCPTLSLALAQLQFSSRLFLFWICFFQSQNFIR